MDEWKVYRCWFRAAAVYNALWGGVVGLFPNLIFHLLHMPRSNYPPLFACIGMMVGVYAIGYWLIAVDPARFGPFVWIGLAGKVLGPLGFVVAAIRGDLPWVFGWVNVSNDLIWLPAFVAFAWKIRNSPSSCEERT